MSNILSQDIVNKLYQERLERRRTRDNAFNRDIHNNELKQVINELSRLEE